MAGSKIHIFNNYNTKLHEFQNYKRQSKQKSLLKNRDFKNFTLN